MERLKVWREKVDRKLEELLKLKEAPPELLDAMRYYPLQKGKRIRPLFTIATASALGGDEEDALVAGCALELLHNYSLIHDDLPCMDDDEFRRGKPTCHVRFGEALALLAGDALLTLSFEVLSRRENFRTLDEGRMLTLVRILAQKSGAEGMVGGQALDISGYEDLTEVSAKKTGALFEASFMFGAVVAGREDLLGDMERLGGKVGLLFQMVDDFLDKDGFYALKGRHLLKDIKELYEDVIRRAERLGGEVPALVELIYRRVSAHDEATDVEDGQV